MYELLNNIIDFLRNLCLCIFDIIQLLWPGATPKSFILWLIGICVLIATFLINQHLNIVVIQPKCKLRLRINDKHKSIKFHIPTKLSSTDEVHKRIDELIKNLRTKYNLVDINFNNFLELQVYGQYDSTIRYNDWVKFYIDEMAEYITAKKTSESIEEYLKPIPLVLRNVGSKSAGKTIVYLEIYTTGRLYDNKCATKSKYSVCQTPDNKSELLSLNYCDITTIEDNVYEVVEYNLNAPQAFQHYQFDISEVMQGRHEQQTVTTFYIDTRKASITTIKWSAIEGSMRKEATGKLTIKVK